MVEGVNRQVVLAARPVGYPQEEDFQIRDAPMPTLGERQVLVRNLWLSLDPYQRGRMSDAPSYTASTEIGDVMTGGTVGRIVASNSGDFAIGEIVQGQLGWQDYAVSNGSNLRKLDPSQAPVSTALGILGMPGLTAYFGLFEVCRPKPGDTVVVSAASGAVGAVVGQLAKMAGCRVVGTAGTQQKIDYITGELGLRCRHQLQDGGCEIPLGRGLPGRRGRLLRQRGRLCDGCGDRGARIPRPHCHLRADIPVQPWRRRTTAPAISGTC